jgi:hypothetical protein
VLDKHERQALDEIERQLSADDPGFASRFGRSSRRVVARRAWRAVGMACAALSVVALVLGALGQFLITALLAALLLGLRDYTVRAL